MAKRPVFTFLTDVNVPDSVGDFLTSQGHDVVRVRDVMAIDATDPVVAQAAMEAKRILVSWDKDFNHQRFWRLGMPTSVVLAFHAPSRKVHLV